MVKRYRMIPTILPNELMPIVAHVPDEQGGWVAWEDYEALQKELDLERGYYTDPDPFQYG